MSRSWFAATAVLLAGAALVPTPPAPWGALTPTPKAGPEVGLPAGPVRAGAQVLVRLTGWPAGTVQIEVCGNAARRGALDCATADATHAPVPPDGTATLPVRLAVPPVACPCLLRVRTPTGGTAVDVTLPLTGVTAPAVGAEPDPPELVLTGLHAVDRRGVGGWFGLPGKVTVQLTLRNPGPVDVLDPPLSLLVGPPGRVEEIVAAPPLGTLAAGQSRNYSFTVPVDVTGLGRYELHGRIEPPGRPLAFTVRTDRRPWGLLAVPGLASALLVTAIRRRRGKAQR
ncbi:hypothetical protein ACN28G_19980 [Micromonospora sp. WMMA1923]|uniref:hypothetical protein n=1 Tax=Micromonospora sp. WMMA1923 TaxID=3404125 RepID=UPI003B935F57